VFTSQPLAYLLARNCLISTSGQKSNVTVVFLDPDFLHDARIPTIREYLRQKSAHLCLRGFLGPFGPKWRFRGKIGEGVGRYCPQRSRSYFWGLLPPCHFWRKSIKKCGQTDIQTHHVPCYMLHMVQITRNACCRTWYLPHS